MSNLLLKKSSFIHIPKCGGSLIQGMLFRLGLVNHRYTTPQNGHLFLHQMTQSESTYNFTFVRHPYTWWPSFWHWSKQDRFSLMERKCPDFDTWIQDYGPFWMGHYSRLVSRYVGDDPFYQSNIKISFVGKNENLYEDLKNAVIASGEDIDSTKIDNVISQVKTGLEQNDPGWVKKQNKKEYNRNISDKSKEIIYNTERYVFDKFNYEP